MAANALCCEAHTGGWVGFGQWSQNSMFYGMVGISHVLLSASVDPFTLGDASPVLFVQVVVRACWISAFLFVFSLV